MNHTDRAAFALALSLAACAAPAFAADAAGRRSADTTDDADLRALVRQQAEQIRELSRRLSELERRPPAGPAAADPVQAQVAAAVADTRDDELAILQAQVAQQAATGRGSGDGARMNWRKGAPEFASGDGRMTFRPRGRLLLDQTFTRGSAFAARNLSGSDLASARLGAEGEFGPLGYKVEADFAGNEVTLKDAYLSYDTRLGGHAVEFYLGNKLKDRSLDGATSGVATPFMERNAVASVGGMQSGYFGLGLSAKVFGDGWHASLAVTGDDVGNAGDASDTVAYLARAHWNPLRGGDGFVHLGGWYWYEQLGADVASINKTSPVALGWNDQVRVSASSIANVDNDRAWGAELGAVYRSGWLFGERTVRTIESDTVGEVRHKASSVYAGWLLTGEKPGFSRRSGVWTATRVLRPVDQGGIGAFELALRYDRYDFTDAARGGDGDAWTLGLNWYLNDWSRLMLNYVWWKTDNKVGAFQGPDSGRTLGLRAQVAF
ncbi:porin [Lysobacter enzymogenes]|uniref:OprO/OprP family phosphate-selective porin n=1 Tax=Lysobacter enzymogenes TaxID=69 RepID=UPI00374921EE